MSILAGIVVYLMIWWVVLFAVLPWGVRIPDETEPGFAASAPEKPRLWLKVAVTSLISAVLWVGAAYLITSDWITFRPQ